MTPQFTKNRPIYNDIVKISDWSRYHEAHPFDNVMKNQSVSHYKSFGATNKIYTPKTSAQEAMETGLNRQYKRTRTHRPIWNFSSHHTQYENVDKVDENYEKQNPLKEISPSISVYKKDYIRHYKQNKKNLLCYDNDIQRRLINRIPKNSFTMINASAPHKFMDNHFYEISPNRNSINLMRQLRNISNVF